MRKWNEMSDVEKMSAFKQAITLFEECDEKVTKIAYDYLDLPYELVHWMIMEYMRVMESLDEHSSKCYKD